MLVPDQRRVSVAQTNLQGMPNRISDEVGQRRDETPIIVSDKTRQGYALRSTLKLAGYFFLRDGR